MFALIYHQIPAYLQFLPKVTLTDINELRLGQKTTTFDNHRKNAAAFENTSFSIMYGRRGRYGQHAHSLDLVCRTPLERRLWSEGVRMLLKKIVNPEEAYVTLPDAKLR